MSRGIGYKTEKALEVEESSFSGLLFGVESGYNTDKIRNIGFTTTEAKTVYAPVINELPLSLECEIVHTVTVGSHMQVTGEVKRILAEETILNEKGRIDLSKLKPVTYDEEQVQYLSVGNKVSDAFNVGMELKKAFDRDAEKGV